MIGSALLLGAVLLAPQALQEPEHGYFMYVTAESEDVVALAHFDPVKGEVSVLNSIQVGYMATEIEGPHGLAVAPDGKHWYLSMAHGMPNGRLYKYTTDTNEVVGMCDLGLFPATMQISEATGLLYCVNFDLHGKMQPSTVSIVDVEEMVEVARTTTGPMPHGSRITPDGLKHYSCSMMADKLYEIDTVSFEVLRTLDLTVGDMGKAGMQKGHMQMGADAGKKKPMEMPKAKLPKQAVGAGHSPPQAGSAPSGHGNAAKATAGAHGQSSKGHGQGSDKMDPKLKPMHGKPGPDAQDKAKMAKGKMGGMAMEGMPMHKAMAKPTWAFPHPTKELVYVALNGAKQVLEVDTKNWREMRRFSTPKGPYNVEISPDGKRMVITYKGAQSIGIWDLEAGKELARVKTTQPITHGVVISPDSRYAFVSNEGIGAQKGTLDVIDLSTNILVSSTEIGLQAGGIAFWKHQ
jgi:DNA-binding beta-propeller fold protein YncE